MSKKIYRPFEVNGYFEISETNPCSINRFSWDEHILTFNLETSKGEEFVLQTFFPYDGEMHDVLNDVMDNKIFGIVDEDYEADNENPGYQFQMDDDSYISIGWDG